jgi:hypothetical protein
MSNTLWALCALALSLLPLWRLARHDPKRLRSLRQPTSSPGPDRKRLVVLLLLPGGVLAAIGQWPAFLIWLGSLTAGGWLLVQLLAQFTNDNSTRKSG